MGEVVRGRQPQKDTLREQQAKQTVNYDSTGQRRKSSHKNRSVREYNQNTGSTFSSNKGSITGSVNHCSGTNKCVGTQASHRMQQAQSTLWHRQSSTKCLRAQRRELQRSRITSTIGDSGREQPLGGTAAVQQKSNRFSTLFDMNEPTRSTPPRSHTLVPATACDVTCKIVYGGWRALTMDREDVFGLRVDLD